MRRAIEILGVALFLASSIAASWLKGDEPWVRKEVFFFLAGAWALSGILIGAAYCNRLGGSVADHFRFAISSGLLLILPLLPLLPFLAFPRNLRLSELFPLTLTIMSILVAVVSLEIRLRARYPLSDGAPPGLAGERRRAVEEVLEKLELRVVSLSVAPRGDFMARVWPGGRRTCVVVLGRRAAETLPGPELAALVAQEACRVKRGGILRSVAPVPAALFCLNALALLSPASDSPPLGGPLGALLCLVTLNMHREKMAGIRIAARLTTPAHTASMIRRVHADPPASLVWVQKSTLLAPFLTRPPWAVQLAPVAGDGAHAVTAYRVVWALALTGFFIAPWGTVVGARVARVALPAPVAWTCAALPAAYTLGILLARLACYRAARASQATSGVKFFRGPWIRCFLLLSLVSSIGFAVAHDLAHEPWLLGAMVLSEVTFIAFLVVGFVRGAFSWDALPRSWRADVPWVAALEHDRPEEALALLEARQPRPQSDPWLVTSRATCLLRLGRLDEARRELDEVVSREESYAPAVRDLCIVELLAGNLSAAEDLADRLARLAPRDPFAWELGGLVALESGELEEADRRFARACDLGGEIAGARAGRALVAIARGERLEEAALWIELARSQEPSSPLVLLAEAGWRQGRGELEEAYVRFAEAVLRLQEQGRYGWIPFHEKFGRRWGLLEAAGGKPAE